jgi:hypothetical protein
MGPHEISFPQAPLINIHQMLLHNSLNASYPMKKLLLLVPVFLILNSCSTGKKTVWKDLFNGRNISGWIQKGGTAAFTVENGEIVGTSALDTPSSFLCTELNYSNFILELEFKVDSTLNSGIQIRSNCLQDYQEGRVHGYQVEIDPSARAWSGGIYDESRRGWLYELSDNPSARKAFIQGEWNKVRVEAMDDTIKTWLNGIPVSWLIDDLTHDGFIALQVHDIGQDSTRLGKQVRWRNIRICMDSLDTYFHMGNPGVKQVNMIPNVISEWEQKNGWKLLFDGHSSVGWRGAYKDSFPDRGWSVKDGVISVLPANGGESVNGGDIVTDTEYADFELTAEFRVSKGANSGIKYYVTESEHNQGSAIGLEYQILDDENHPDAKLGSHEGSRTLASLYDLIPATSKRVNAIGEWNRARIISYHGHVEHWLNGFKVLEYERGSKDFRKLVSESKYRVWKNFGEAKKGYILLQDHGSAVDFRSIKMKVL